jgi:hypothetical protein
MRWRKGRSTYRPAHEPIDAGKFYVERVDERAAREFVITHHYSKSFPAAIACYGLFERLAPHHAQLSGVAVFSVSMQPRAADAYGARGEPFCELGRFVLLDEVAGNGETWFMARALRQLGVDKQTASRSPKYTVCLAYSDPVPRTNIRGDVTHAGHVGHIYGAANAAYLGRSSPRSLWLTPDGTTLSPRAISKLRNDESGARYAYDMLISAGAPKIDPMESGSDYVDRALREGPFRRFRHRGNHAFIIPCGTHSDRKRVREMVDKNLPRPVTLDPVSA